MTKEDAIQAMSNGYFVRHRHFSDNEYIGIVGGRIITEEGYRTDLIEFFRWRTDESWNTDWSIVKDKVPIEIPNEYNVIAHKSQSIDLPDQIVVEGRQIGKAQVQRILENKIKNKGGKIIKQPSIKSTERMNSNKFGLMGLFLAMMGAGRQSDQVLDEQIQKAKREPKCYGTRFEINGVEIYALNRKNAERKYKNLKRNG